MQLSLSGGDPREPRARRAARHAAVVWLLLVQPVLLALTLDRALPRLAVLGPAAWALLGAHVALVGGGIAVARRLRAHEAAWGAVAIWACAAIGLTLLERAWPVLPTTLAPSEARVAAFAAIVRDAAIALAAAWLARAGTTVGGDAARGRDST